MLSLGFFYFEDKLNHEKCIMFTNRKLFFTENSATAGQQLFILFIRYMILSLFLLEYCNKFNFN